MRATLWGESESIRGKHGFVYQSSKRPFQEQCLSLHDVDRSYVSDSSVFDLEGVVAPVFFLNLDTGFAYTPDAVLQASPAALAQDFALVLDSL